MRKSRGVLIHRCQPVRLRIRQRLQQRRIHKRKQRHARRNPQRQDQHRRHRKTRILPQLPEGKAQILQQVFDQRQRVPLAIRLPRPLHAAHFQDRAPARLLRRHSRALVLLRLHLDVALDLVRHLLLARRSATESTHPLPPCT